MQLRSGKIIRDNYTNDINFDEASQAWRNNKISLTNGVFKYKTPKRKLYKNKP